MKKIIILAISLSFCVFYCKKEHKTSSKLSKNDTITTASGLKYYYIKKGDGPKAMPGAQIDTYLSLMINDSVIWDTNDYPDSTFSYVHENTSLIKGFTEVTSYLREGDEIIAILPYTIAYGEEGRGKLIPPKATLVYDQFKVLKVHPPKISLADTLFNIINTDGIDKMKATAESIITKADSTNYLLDEGQWIKLWNKLNDANLNNEALSVLDHYKTDNNRFLWYKAQTLNKLEQYESGISVLEYLIKIDSNYTKSSNVIKTLNQMKTKINHELD